MEGVEIGQVDGHEAEFADAGEWECGAWREEGENEGVDDESGSSLLASSSPLHR